MKKVIRFCICFLMILSLTACGANKPSTFSFEAMDTVMSFKIYGLDYVGFVMEEYAKILDSLLSTEDEESEIYRLNHDGSATLGIDALTLVKRSLELSAELKDSFDPTVYPAVREWGFISGNYQIPDETRLSELTKHIDSSAVTVSGNTVTLPEGAAIDLGAVAKGYLADECRDDLDSSEATGAILNLGGTILLYGKKPDGSDFKVGVADPEDPASYFGYLSCGEGVIATSGGYERFFEKDGKRYIHILDPTTAKPVDNGTLSVTVFSHDGVLSDALSTALFVMGADHAAAYYRTRDDFEFILLTDNGKLYITDGIADSFTLADGYTFDMIKLTKQRGV